MTGPRTRPISVLAFALALVGCGAGVAPEELHTARDAVQKASQGHAAQLAPVQLDEAQQALTRAEDAFKGGDDDANVKDLSYLAVRRAEIAVSAANLEQAKRAVAQAQRDKEAAQQGLLSTTRQQLAAEQQRGERDRSRAAEEQRRLDEAAKKGQAEVARVQKQLEDEKKAREAAEKKAAAALASLEAIAKVKEEARGVVITLSGSVLFASGKSELLPIAREKLDEVAKALKDQGYKKIVVEGHTDSRGSASQNEALSYSRAQEVRNYLVSRGIESAKAEAVGHGPRRPIADNNTAEGRANNRRVEIVVTPDRG